MKKSVNLIGFLGFQHDVPRKNGVFRPSVALCMQPGFSVKTFYLLYSEGHEKLLQNTQDAIAVVSPDTVVEPVKLEFEDPFDPMCTFSVLHALCQRLPQEEDYLISLSTGTHVQTYAFLKLIEARFIRAKLIQVFCRGKETLPEGAPSLVGQSRIIDLELAKYDDYHTLMQNREEAAAHFLKRGIVTVDPVYNQTIKELEFISQKSRAAILLEGETGTGKSELAKQIYALKRQRGVVEGEFISLNCATLNAEQAQSTLFGHVKGAFTGAMSAREGLLRRAHGGVLFLDEINSMPVSVQGMLLLALETGVFYPMGSDKPQKSNFALICGTNESLSDCVRRGEFRQDLLSRLDLWHFVLPPLRERKGDIAPNLEFELTKWSNTNRRSARINREAKKAYLDFAMSKEATWQRNFRDLSGSVERMCTLSEGVVTLNCVNAEIARLSRAWGMSEVNEEEKKTSDAVRCATSLLDEAFNALSLIEKAELITTLNACLNASNATDAARVLYNKAGALPVNPTSRLANMLKRYDLDFSRIKSWR